MICCRYTLAPMDAPRSVEVLRRLEKAAAALEPTRLRLLAELATPEGDSATGLARRLGLPRQRVNYHLRELERAGLVEVVREQKKGNCVERIVRATARSYLISPEVLGGAAPKDNGEVRDRLDSACLVSAAARAVRDVAILRDRGEPPATFAVEVEVRFASDAEREAFAEDLANEVAKLAAEYHDQSAPHGRVYRFIIGGYPAITTPEGGQGSEDAGH
jgi:DNA-binding transcriptional ArsR family regulator